MEDHDTIRSNGFAKPIHSNPLAASRSLHVVIDGPGQGGNNNNKTAKGKHGPTKSDSSNLLSCLYAIIVILLSLLFPLTEALNDKWLQTEYYAAFIVYQQVVACAFLLYLQLYLLRVEHSHGIHITDAAKDNFSPSAKKPRPESRYKKILKHFTGSKAALAHVGTVNEGFSDPESPGKAQNGPTVSAKLRCTRSLSNLNDRGADILSDRRNAMTDFSELNSGGMSLYRPDSTCSLDLDQEEFGDYVDEDSEVWIDAGRLGNLFSHEGSSFYLRMGCVLFAIGNVVFICLELQTNSQTLVGCPATPFWWVYIFRLAYLLLQTFFIFKHPHIHITKHEPLVRFGLMHLIATNMGIWIRTLVSEISLEYDHLQHLPKNNSSTGAHAAVEKMALAAGNLQPDSAAAGAESPNCRGVLQGSAGYLFPFVLEYSLIALGTFIIMYLSINENSNNSVVQGLSNLMKIHALEEQPAPDAAAPDSVSVSSRSSEASKNEEENILKKSHRGLFAGIILLSGSLISTVMFFFQLEKYPLTSQIIYLSTDITINVVMMIGAVIAIIKLNVLNYVEKPASVDDVLLLLSMAGGVLFEFTRVFASTNALIVHNGNDSSTLFLTIFSGITASAQIIVQVVLVVSGMRRYPSKLQHIKKMPGRGCIIFLLIGNISVWIYRTLQAKEFVLHEEEMAYYGQLAWLLLVNISLPLLLFFRFHSSICLADVWHSAYTPLHQKIAKAQPTAGDGGHHHREASVRGEPGEGGEMEADRVSISGLLRSVSMGNLSAALQTESRFNKHSSRNAAFLKRGDTMLTELGDIEMVHADDHRLRM